MSTEQTPKTPTPRLSSEHELFLFDLRYNSRRMSQCELADWYEIKVVTEFTALRERERKLVEALEALVSADDRSGQSERIIEIAGCEDGMTETEIEYCEAVRKARAALAPNAHSPDCDVNDQNPEGIRKPCNCGATPAPNATGGEKPAATDTTGEWAKP